MTKTLADMTPEERAACRGMWADIRGEDLPDVTVVVFYEDMGAVLPEYKGVANVISPTEGKTCDFKWENIYPRFDMPRAWEADGKPIEVDWQYANYRPGLSRGFYSMHESVEKGIELPKGTTVACRWVGEWEPADD